MMISNSFVGEVYYWPNVVIKGVILGYMFGSFWVWYQTVVSNIPGADSRPHFPEYP